MSSTNGVISYGVITWILGPFMTVRKVVGPNFEKTYKRLPCN